MTDDDRDVQTRFASYRRELSGEVRAPGVEAVHRTVFRRQRRRTMVAGWVAVAAIGLAAVQVAVRDGTDVGPVAPASPSAAGTTAAPASPSGAASSDTRPSATGSTSGPPTSSPPATSASAAVQVPPARTFPVVDGVELHVVALSEVRLQPVGDSYRGTVYVDVYNSGRQSGTQNNVYVTVPAGARWDTTVDPPINGGCGLAPPEVGAPAGTVACPAEALPAGRGYRRMAFHLVVAIAPGPAVKPLDGFQVRVFVADGPRDAPDRTPADNMVAVRLLLPPP
jgi:hypothetical protein